MEIKVNICFEDKENALKTFAEALAAAVVQGPTANFNFNGEGPILPVADTVKVENAPAPAPAPEEATPTAEVAYRFEDIQKCAAELCRAGKREELGKVLKVFKLATLLELTPDHYNDFAARLREIGGKI